MGIEVVGQDDAPAAAPSLSPLEILRAKRIEMESELFLDLAVPRWELGDQRLWVRYGPGNPNLFTAQIAKREKAHQAAVQKGQRGDPDWMTQANADVLVDACRAVYLLPSDEQPPKGPLPHDIEHLTFSSPELSDLVGAPPNAAATVRKVYLTSADVLIAVTQLLNWSGQVSEEADQSFLDT